MSKADIIKSIPNLEQLYVIYSRLTHLPYMERNIELLDNQIYVFTDEARAIARAQSFTSQSQQPSMAVKIDKKNMLKMFAELYAYGVDALVFQTGEDYYRIRLDEIVKRPDFSSLPKDKRPLLNPKLQLNMIYYMQEFRKGPKNVDKQKLEETGRKMMGTLLCAPYLIPFNEVQNEDGQKTLQLVFIKGANNASLIPIFSDAIEYSHFKGNQNFKLSLTDFTKLSKMTFPKEMTGFIINPSSVGVLMLNDYLQKDSTQQFLQKIIKK